jgi:penicillin-binding protein 1C
MLAILRAITKKQIPRNKHKGKIIFSKKIRWWRKYAWRLIDVISIFVILLAGIFLFYKNIIADLPNVNTIYNPPRLSTKILDKNDKILFKFYEDEDRSWVPLEKIPQNLINATIAIEDKEFYYHRGISIKGVVKAVWYNLRHKKGLRGGSTITQQLVKNVFLSNKKNLKRKIQEAILAVIIENRLSKNEILERYFNQVAYGGETYGVQEAALKFFGKNVWELNTAEAAFLAGLPAAPTVYNFLDLALVRQKQVIDQMVVAKFVTEEEADRLKEENINISKNHVRISAPHFVFYVRDYVLKRFNIENFSRGGWVIKTSLDSEIQKMAEQITREEIEKVKHLNISNGAVLIIDVKNGDILAMVGGVNGDFNVTTALRQPGSSIKPINYLLALKRGFLISSTIEDTPTSFPIKGQKPYAPQNYGNKYNGKVTLKTALASSLNIPSVKLLKNNGIDNMRELGIKMGITTWEDPSKFGLSLALGANEVKMIDMASAYSTFANLGERVTINPVLKINNYLNEERYSKITEMEKIIEKDYAFIINWALSDDTARAPAFGLNSKLKIPDKTVAVKTGTTNNLRDNWCIGWTPSYLVAVWVGNNDNSPMSKVASGISGATPIWNRIMSNLLLNKENENWQEPEGIIEQLSASKSSQLLKE